MYFDWKIVVIAIVVALAIIIGCIFIVQGAQNRAFSLEEQVSTAEADIKVQEKRRIDLVYNLADCVLKYDEHEAEVLITIAESKKQINDSENLNIKLNALAEAYPALKSNENYKEFMNELAMTENLIANYRSNYNNQIKNYNRYVRKFPTRWYLSILGYECIDYSYLDFNAPTDAPQDLFGGK